MSVWAVEVHILDVDTGDRFVVRPEEGPTAEMVVALANVRACFVYTTPDGKELRCWGEKPTVNPLTCTLSYYCEGQKDHS